MNQSVDKEESIAVANQVYASSYVVMERSSNNVLEGSNMHQTRSVASISKIMTAIIAIENANLEDVVTIPEEINQVYGSMLYIHANEQISLLDLIYGLILRSGNDAAISIALHISPSIEQFVALMNQKAKLLGMENSLFRNPHGLDEEDGGNISSAYDMALLHSYGLNNPVYRKIVGCQKYKTYTNKNKLLSLYDYTTGGKTGFTTKARRTLVSSALKDDLELVIVTLNCGGDFQTHKNLYMNYFEKYEGLIVLKNGVNYLDNYRLTVEKEYVFLVKKDENAEYQIKYEVNYKEKIVNIYLLDNKGYILNQFNIQLYKLDQKQR